MRRWSICLLCCAACAIPSRRVESPTRPAAASDLPTAHRLPEGWIEAWGEARLVNLTPKEAREQALQAAREAAIQFDVGVEIRTGDYLIQEDDGSSFRDAFLSFSRQTSSGRIVEVRSEKWDEYKIPEEPLPITVYRARILARVEALQGRPDPDFAVKVTPNKESFSSGEQMRLAITATRPCHVTVLNITAADTVVVILPHEHRPKSFVAPGDTLWVPDEQEQAIGISYRVTTPDGLTQATERIMVVATKTERPLGAGWRRTGLYNQVPTRKAALEQLMRWLVQIPREEWTEAEVVYRVQAAG